MTDLAIPMFNIPIDLSAGGQAGENAGRSLPRKLLALRYLALLRPGHPQL